MPTCKDCLVAKTRSEFYLHRKGEYVKVCKPCYNAKRKEYQKGYKLVNRNYLTGNENRKRMAKKKLAVDLFGGICYDCKQSFPLCVYDFHHLDPATKRQREVPSSNRQVNFTRSWENIKKELEKCIMLCSNCHRIRHHEWTFPSKPVKRIKRGGGGMQLSIPLMPRDHIPSMEPIGVARLGI